MPWLNTTTLSLLPSKDTNERLPTTVAPNSPIHKEFPWWSCCLENVFIKITGLSFSYSIFIMSQLVLSKFDANSFQNNRHQNCGEFCWQRRDVEARPSSWKHGGGTEPRAYWIQLHCCKLKGSLTLYLYIFWQARWINNNQTKDKSSNRRWGSAGDFYSSCSSSAGLTAQFSHS